MKFLQISIWREFLFNQKKKSWLIYFRERFYLPAYLFLSIGLCLSSMHFSQGHFELLPFVLSLVGALLVFLATRLIHDHNDFHRDLILHPSRPLSRGVIHLLDAKHAALLLSTFIFLYGFLIFVFYQKKAGFFACCLSLFYFLLLESRFLQSSVYREFFYPYYRNAFIFLLILFGVSLSQPDLSFLDNEVFFFALLAYSSILSAEVSRKIRISQKAKVNIKDPQTLVERFSLFSLALIYALQAFSIQKLRFPFFFDLVLIGVIFLTLLSRFNLIFQTILERLSVFIVFLHFWSIAILHFAMRSF